MRRSPPGRVGPALMREIAARDVQEQPAALVPEALDHPRRDRGLPGGDPGEAPEDVRDTSQSTGPPASSTRRASQPSRRFLAIRNGNSGRA